MKKNINIIMLLVLLSIFAISCGDKKADVEPQEETQIEATDATETAEVVAEEPMVVEPEPAEDTEAKTEETKVEPAKTGETDEKAAPAPKAGGLVGQVVLLDNIAKGGDGPCTKAEAEAARGKGGVLLFKANGKLYFVMTESGAFAGKRLLDYCGKPQVTIEGKVGSSNGLNTIIMTSIE